MTAFSFFIPHKRIYLANCH